jgi:nitroreductase
MAAARSLVQVIRNRRSVRAYAGEAIPAAAYAELVAACGSLTRGPLGTECRIRLVEDVWSVWGTRLFLAGAARRGPHALEDLGRLLEELVLRATGLILGTCWIGLGFPQRSFAEALALSSEEILPAVVAVGVPSGRQTAYGLAARLATGAARRKPWGELFFDGDYRTPLPELTGGGGAAGGAGATTGAGAAGPYALALEMVRLAPSAQNRQPWRVVRTGPAVQPARGAQPTASDRPRFHFYRQKPAGLLSFRPDWLRLDIGIAMAHFELTLAEAGARGRWSAADPAPDIRLPRRTDYVASWLPEELP